MIYQRDLRPADEDLKRRVQTHDDADGHDHFEMAEIGRPRRGSRFWKTGPMPLQQSSAMRESQNHM